jgi:hypothetical protein
MKPGKRGWMAGLVIGTCLLLAREANAGPYVEVMQPCDCPPTHYSAFHILTPIAYRWAAWCRGPCHYTFAKNLYPDVAPTHYITKYHCPSVNPLQFSVLNYPGLGEPPPGSTYQAPPPPEKQKEPRETSPQELPSPKVEEERLPPPKEERKPERLPRPKEEPKK